MRQTSWPRWSISTAVWDARGQRLGMHQEVKDAITLSVWLMTEGRIWTDNIDESYIIGFNPSTWSSFHQLLEIKGHQWLYSPSHGIILPTACGPHLPLWSHRNARSSCHQLQRWHLDHLWAGLMSIRSDLGLSCPCDHRSCHEGWSNWTSDEEHRWFHRACRLASSLLIKPFGGISEAGHHRRLPGIWDYHRKSIDHPRAEVQSTSWAPQSTRKRCWSTSGTIIDPARKNIPLFHLIILMNLWMRSTRPSERQIEISKIEKHPGEVIS